MLNLNQIFALTPEPPQQVHVSFSKAVDFCVWALEQDGLHAPFFDLHPLGTSSLQSCGLTTLQWQQWFHAVVRRQDSALIWNGRGLDALTWTETQLSRYQQMAAQIQAFPEFEHQSVEDIDFEHLRSTLLHHYHVYQQRQDAAKQRCGEPEFDCRSARHPVDAFTGLSEVKKRLFLLWEQYQDQYGKYSRIQMPSSVIQTQTTNSELIDLPRLNIFVVSYPAATEVLLPPNSVVVSNLHIQSDASFEELIYWAADRLNDL